MAPLLTIGEFSRMTHVSVKALRHYDDVGLLAPAEVDRFSGYRYYALAQVPVAQAIRRFRDLDMPIDAIRLVLAEPGGREAVIVEHLRTMQDRLEQTQSAVASLRELLEQPAPTGPVEHRVTAPAPAVAVSDTVEWDDAEAWLEASLQKLHDSGVAPAGPDGALYSAAFFEAHIGEVTAFVPAADSALALPGGAYAVIVHDGPFSTLDTAYGTLGAYVTERGIGADGPVRENYLDDGRTEVCWPVTA